ncbi:MAG: DUF4392 domain-containing protein [Christensenellaceae bacterium]|jgi:hypothetical protein|nr:DUF4392 domain-containing protein [Christensenellaceae bacterium]
MSAFTQEDLTNLNIGQNLDNLMNLDPRGYGVCRILYKASRDYTGKPLSINFAEQLIKVVEKDDLVFIIVGFVLLPHKKAEMDGINGAMILARAIYRAFGAKPVIVCPEDNLVAVENMAYDAGLHLYKNVEDVKKYPISMGVITFTKNIKEAAKQIVDIKSTWGLPAALIAIEAPGANEKGVYHNATGLDMTEYEAKADLMFKYFAECGVKTFAIGDLGNEMGMGTIKSHIEKYIPYARANACRCECKGGIVADSAADVILTATVSDWGAYAVTVALAFLLGNDAIAPTPELIERIMITASRSGMVDMYGDLIPSVDGFDKSIVCAIVALMRECIAYAPKLKNTCATWFEKTLELDFFGENKIY